MSLQRYHYTFFQLEMDILADKGKGREEGMEGRGRGKGRGIERERKGGREGASEEQIF